MISIWDYVAVIFPLNQSIHKYLGMCKDYNVRVASKKKNTHLFLVFVAAINFVIFGMVDPVALRTLHIFQSGTLW